MSDFDKEAERERLRKQFEQEEDKREATERMSELLLKGATMTNAHCGNCGDPIFRYDGREFCPTCQQPVEETGRQSDQPEESDTDAATDDASESVDERVGTESTDESDVATEEVASGASSEDPSAATEPSTTDRPSPADAAERVDQAAPEQSQRDVESAGGAARTETASVPSLQPTEGATLGDAEASLTRTLVRFAREAEAADRPREARDHLEAAREAAEALAALSETR